MVLVANKCSFWKGGTCSYFLSFCQQLNSCVPNGLKLSQNIVWQPWKQNLTIIDFQSIHSMNPHIPQSGETVETGGGEHRYLVLNFVESTWSKKVWTRYWPHYFAVSQGTRKYLWGKIISLCWMLSLNLSAVWTAILLLF